MAGYNTPFQGVVAFFMKRFGAPATITIDYGTGTYVDGTYTPDTATINVKVLPFDYIKKTDGLATESDTLIQTGDKQVFIQPTETLQVINPAFMKLNMAGDVWKFVAIKNCNPTLNDSVYFECYVRK